jgi:hypothetical protein
MRLQAFVSSMPVGQWYSSLLIIPQVSRAKPRTSPSCTIIRNIARTDSYRCRSIVAKEENRRVLKKTVFYLLKLRTNACRIKYSNIRILTCKPLALLARWSAHNLLTLLHIKVSECWYSYISRPRNVRCQV